MWYIVPQGSAIKRCVDRHHNLVGELPSIETHGDLTVGGHAGLNGDIQFGQPSGFGILKLHKKPVCKHQQNDLFLFYKAFDDAAHEALFVQSS
jgi:hypothetical protein